MFSPWFSVMSSLKNLYAVSLVKLYSLVWNRFSKLSPVRVSSVVHVVPSFEPCTVQFCGSRPSASLAEVSAYLRITTGAEVS